MFKIKLMFQNLNGHDYFLLGMASGIVLVKVVALFVDSIA